MICRLGALAALSLMIAGCVMPRAGSSYSEVQEASAQGRINLVPVTPSTLPAAPAATGSFPAEFVAAEPVAQDALGPGDTVNIRVIEGGTPTVFTANNGDLGEIPVDERGRVFVPFAGSFQAADRTAAELRVDIARRLRTVVRNPQVDVRPVKVRSRLVSVQGNAAKAGTYPIERGRTRLGELLGEVAPDLKTPEMMDVTVRRDGRAGTVRMADILANPSLDIALRPGDSIVLNAIVQQVTVLGAAGAQGQVRIERRDFSVADVLGQSRGLNDDAADPRGVYLIRATGQGTPVVYQFEMRDPQTVALAGRFRVRDKDTVYISNAPFTQTRKALGAITQSLGGIRSAVTVVP
ncbi:polysaccharide biosynthesis/export family protein [Sphingomonas rhizophila]|uniref:Polysaccharide biosynthesis/export family protein n=1 Tax=Sphingomonas rhizophila TaxID=2071607 RepID=A0A7G9SBR9_9SPHN|nr:polysaccharide biosynthesis/export family protein [Sphingomonas rhizophila]QNN65294.1 polysaccharide biosynthesis/export family protein [Sphingomonas rhizophila]